MRLRYAFWEIITMNDDKNKKSIQDKLANIKYNCDSKSHLILDQEKCKNCKEKTCTFICPANVYEYNEQLDEITVVYENCLECGACKLVCEKKSIEWHWPKASCGVVFKNS